MTEPRSNPLVALAGQTVVVIGGSAGIGLETSDDPGCGRPSPPSGLQERDNGR